jgi:hypothetical protein
MAAPTPAATAPTSGPKAIATNISATAPGWVKPPVAGIGTGTIATNTVTIAMQIAVREIRLAVMSPVHHFLLRVNLLFHPATRKDLIDNVKILMLPMLPNLPGKGPV